MWLKYSNAPIEFDWARVYPQPEVPSAFGKPNGFWITDDTDENWRSWCVGEGFGIEHLTHKHEIGIDETRVLILRSEEEVVDFHRQYSFPWQQGGGPDRRFGNHKIDWRRAATDHAGIIITPYIWRLSMSDVTPWYYGWNCASGCIWDTSAIWRVNLTAIEPVASEEHVS